MDVLKASQKDIYWVNSLGRPQDFNFEPLLQMHFHFAILNRISPNVCLKHQKDNCFIVLRFAAISQRDPINVIKWLSEFGGWTSREVVRTSILNINTKCIFAVIFSALVQQICVLSIHWRLSTNLGTSKKVYEVMLFHI